MKNVFSLFIAMFLCFTSMSSQSVAQLDSSARGTEFWITFPPNVHILNNPLDQLADSLFLFVVSDQEANVTVEFTNFYGETSSESFTVPANGVGVFQKRWYGYELVGGQNSSINSEVELPIQLGQPAPQHFVVTSDVPVLVYGMSQAVYSTDAFLAIPKRHLGRHHVLLTYESDSEFRVDTTTTRIFDNRMPSQFAVLATEDSTEVSMQLTTNDSFFDSDSIVVQLNKGESYLVQANMAIRSDFSGSVVRSTKPISVFTGHQRAYVPSSIVREIHEITESNEFLESNLTRDYLLEQSPSLKHLGTEYVVGTYVAPRDMQVLNGTDDTDKVRVVAVYDNTTVSVNGTDVALLNTGDMYEQQLTRGLHIQGTQPIHVGALKKSSSHFINNSITSGRDTVYGDPFLVYTADVQQWDTAYTVYNTQALPQLDVPDPEAYPYQYIQVTGTREALLSLSIDGFSLSQLGSIVRTVDNSTFFFANVSVASGVHQLQSSLPFGVTVYGYGLINSYGYIAGSAYRRISPEPEGVLFRRDSSCFLFESHATGPATTLANIDSVELENGSLNTSLTFDIDRTADTALAEIVLENLYQDGVANYKVVDSDGLSFRDTILIPGFTLGLVQNPSPEFLEVDFSTSIDRTWCFEYVLENYGQFVQSIEELSISADDQFTIDVPDVTTLAPGESITITVCFEAEEPGLYAAELVLVGPCLNRDLVQFEIESGIDDTPPQFEQILDSCGVLAEIFVSEDHRFSSGLRSVQIEELNNISVQVLSESPENMSFSIAVDDPYQDAWFTLRAVDSAGLSQEYSDTIPGLTLLASNFPDWTVEEYRPAPSQLFICDTVTIANYGLFNYTITASNFANNGVFSAPPRQFPIVVPAGESAELVVCLQHPRGQEFVEDAFVFQRGCTQRELIFTSALPVESLRGETRCRVVLTGEFVHNTESLVLSAPYPNPAANDVVVDVKSPESALIALVVSDANGRTRIAEQLQVHKGKNTITTDVSDLQAGAYTLLIQRGGEIHRTQIVVLP